MDVLAAWAAVIVAVAAIIIDRWTRGRVETRAEVERIHRQGERDGQLLQILDELKRIAADHEARLRELQRSRR